MTVNHKYIVVATEIVNALQDEGIVKPRNRESAIYLICGVLEEHDKPLRLPC